MSLKSMTGFGKGEAEDESFLVTVEIKAVNHRFKDIRFKMSSLFNAIEIDLKKKIFEKFKRGSFDVYINFKRSDSNSKFTDIDENKVLEFIKTIKKITDAAQVEIKISPSDFLRNEFLKEKNTQQDELLEKLTMNAMECALENLAESRLQEGIKLQQVILEHKEKYEFYFNKITGLADKFQQSVLEKLKKRFEELKVSIPVDEPRFLQEVVFYLEKMDVEEEINRIKIHLDKLGALVSADGEAGRQIDFIIQELNRETNTIGSKSNMSEISSSVINMKVQLEKIREQGLNLE